MFFLLPSRLGCGKFGFLYWKICDGSNVFKTSHNTNFTETSIINGWKIKKLFKASAYLSFIFSLIVAYTDAWYIYNCTYINAEAKSTIMTIGHSSLENISLKLYSKWLRKGYVWEVSWRLNRLQHTDPIISPTRLTPTNRTSCRTCLYHCLTSTCFLWASHLHPVQPVHSQGYTLISSTGCTSSLIDGWVAGQYVT